MCVLLSSLQLLMMMSAAVPLCLLIPRDRKQGSRMHHHMGKTEKERHRENRTVRDAERKEREESKKESFFYRHIKSMCSHNQANDRKCA